MFSLGCGVTPEIVHTGRQQSEIKQDLIPHLLLLGKT